MSPRENWDSAALWLSHKHRDWAWKLGVEILWVWNLGVNFLWARTWGVKKLLWGVNFSRALELVEKSLLWARTLGLKLLWARKLGLKLLWAWNWGLNLLSSTPRWHSWARNVGVILLISSAVHHHHHQSLHIGEQEEAFEDPLPIHPPALPSLFQPLPSLPQSISSRSESLSYPTGNPAVSWTVYVTPSIPNATKLVPNINSTGVYLPSLSQSNRSHSQSIPSHSHGTPSTPVILTVSRALYRTPLVPNTTKLFRISKSNRFSLLALPPTSQTPDFTPPSLPSGESANMADVMLCKVVLASAILVFWAAFWVIHLIGIIYGYRRLHQRRGGGGTEGGGGREVEGGVLGVSVLKPLVGTPMDPHLAANLETFFTLNYPKYELLFCIQEEGDPSIGIVQELMKKHPHIDASYFVGGKEVGVNPKINNMQPGYLAAKHELLLISDSGLMMKEDTLTDMVSHMTPDVGIVHQMPFCCDRKGWPAILEKVYFGTGHARMYLFLGLLDALGLGVNCCTGMSCLMRKKVLDEAGGISAFGIYLAEDYFFAKYIQDQGWGIRIASQPAWQNAGICRVKTFLSRLTRWCKLRIAMVPHTLLLEPFSECMVLGLVASWAACVLLHADYLTFFLFHTLTWSLADWIMLNIVQNGPPPFSKFEFAVSWLFREASALFLFLHAVWNPVISWRTGAFKLRWWGRAEPVNTRVTVM